MQMLPTQQEVRLEITGLEGEKRRMLQGHGDNRFGQHRNGRTSSIASTRRPIVKAHCCPLQIKVASTVDKALEMRS